MLYSQSRVAACLQLKKFNILHVYVCRSVVYQQFDHFKTASLGYPGTSESFAMQNLGTVPGYPSPTILPTGEVLRAYSRVGLKVNSDFAQEYVLSE
jgi:hypothetical protein